MHATRLLTTIALLYVGTVPTMTAAQPVQPCDKACLESIGQQYRAAYLAHDPSKVAIARGVAAVQEQDGGLQRL